MPRLEITDMTQEDIQDFWARVVKGATPESCWFWIGGDGKPSNASHTMISVRRKRAVVARIVYELTFGATDPKLVFHRKCQTEACINPLHLAPGERVFNTRVELPPEVAPVLFLWKKGRRVDQIAAKLHVEPPKIEEIAREFRFPKRPVINIAPVPLRKRCPDCTRIYTGYAGDDTPHNCSEKSPVASIYISKEAVA